MLTDVTSIQAISDRIKGFILKSDVSAGFKNVSLRILTGLENLPWVPLAMEKALEATPGLQIDPAVSFEGTDDDALVAIDRLIREYETLIQPGYTAEQAAKALGIKIDQFNKYTQSGRIAPDRVIGTVRFFSQAEIDRFKTERRPRGRQPAPKTEG
jgi:hypothetical protein